VTEEVLKNAEQHTLEIHSIKSEEMASEMKTKIKGNILDIYFI
jgi:predicted small metal-binding protein